MSSSIMTKFQPYCPYMYLQTGLRHRIQECKNARKKKVAFIKHSCCNEGFASNV